jgi:hypothetical protein
MPAAAMDDGVDARNRVIGQGQEERGDQLYGAADEGGPDRGLAREFVVLHVLPPLEGWAANQHAARSIGVAPPQDCGAMCGGEQVQPSTGPHEGQTLRTPM